MLITVPERLAQIRPNLRCLAAADAIPECREVNGVVIDVREPEECAKEPVTGSINIPRGLIEMKALQLFPDPNHPIYIHCASGARATLSAEQLRLMGYENVTVITCAVGTVKQICEL